MIFFADGAFLDLAGSNQEGQSYNYWGDFVNMLITLGFIIVLIFVSVWFLKKIMRSRIQHLNKCTGIKILERRSLTPKSSLYLVDVLGKGIVISESASGIQLITEFTPDVNVELLLEERRQEEKPAKESFAQKLRKLASKNG